MIIWQAGLIGFMSNFDRIHSVISSNFRLSSTLLRDLVSISSGFVQFALVVIFILLHFCLCHFMLASLLYRSCHCTFCSAAFFTSGSSYTDSYEAIAAVNLANLSSKDKSICDFSQCWLDESSYWCLIRFPFDVILLLLPYDVVSNVKGFSCIWLGPGVSTISIST